MQTDSPSERSPERRPLLLKVAIFFVVLAAAGYGAKVWFDGRQLDAEIADLVAEAEDLHSLQEYSKMAVLVGDALEKHPERWELLFQMGRADLGNKRPNEATRHLEAAATGAPSDEKPEIYLRLGKAYEARMRGSTDKKKWILLAQSCYTEALKGEGTSARALELSATLEITAFKAKVEGPPALRRSLRAFEQLLDEHGDDPDVPVDDVKRMVEGLQGMLEKSEESAEE